MAKIIFFDSFSIGNHHCKTNYQNIIMADYYPGLYFTDNCELKIRWIWQNGHETTLTLSSDNYIFNSQMTESEFIDAVKNKSVTICNYRNKYRSTMNKKIYIRKNHLMDESKIIHKNAIQYIDVILEFIKQIKILSHGYNLYLFHLTIENPSLRFQIIKIKEGKLRWRHIDNVNIDNPMTTDRFEECINFINSDDRLCIGLTDNVVFTHGISGNTHKINNEQEAKDFLSHIEIFNEIKKDFPEDVFPIYYQRLLKTKKTKSARK